MRELKSLVAAAGGPHVRLQQLSFGSCVLKDATSCQQCPTSIVRALAAPDVVELAGYDV